MSKPTATFDIGILILLFALVIDFIVEGLVLLKGPGFIAGMILGGATSLGITCIIWDYNENH